MANNYFKVIFTIKDKKYISPYTAERKVVYFTAPNEQDIVDYVKDNSIDCNGVYDYSIKPCKKEDLSPYPTDGFRSLVIPKNDVIGSIDITEREWLVEWELREHDGEYAKVLRRVNFIVKAKDAKTAGLIADDYSNKRRYCYGDDYTYYIVTENPNTIAEVKKSGNFVAI